MENRDETFDCSCPFTGTQQPGKDGQTTEANDTDAAKWISACRDTFLGRKWPGYNDDISNVCTNLSTAEGSKSMWFLYWCDATFGGVEQAKGYDDPSVNWIINRCHDKKLAPPLDPGVPPAAYELMCRASAEVCRTITLSPSLQTPSFSILDVSDDKQATKTTMVMATRTTSPKPDNNKDATSITAIHEVSSDTGKVIMTASPSTSPMSSPGTHPELSTGIKAAIGVSIGVGALLLIFIAICITRRCFGRGRRSSYHQSIKAHIRHHCQRGGSSPTPLISPYHSHTNSHSLASSGSGAASQASTNDAPLSPLSPPLLLRHRKFLPSLLSLNPLSSRSSSPPLTSLSPPRSPINYSFPASPVCRPEETTRLSPRPERTVRPPHTPTLPPPVFPGAHSICGSGYSTSSPVTTAPSSLRKEVIHNATATIITKPAAVAAMAIPKPTRRQQQPLSPVRPARPHEAPLHIPDLVSPASPTFPHPLSPPPRSPIPDIPTSRTQSISSGRTTPRPKRAQAAAASVKAAHLPVPSPATSPRINDPKNNRNSSSTLVPAPPEVASPPREDRQGNVADDASESSHDLAELSWEYARETAARSRESWGSWTAGAPGLARGSGSGRAFTGGGEGLGERDLERLGGGY